MLSLCYLQWNKQFNYNTSIAITFWQTGLVFSGTNIHVLYFQLVRASLKWSDLTNQIFVEALAIRSYTRYNTGPVFTKLFRIRIKIRLKLNILLQRTFFETYFYYVTIDCWCLIHYLLQTRLLGILSFFCERKGKS